MNKIGCFIHSTTMCVWNDDILIYMLQYLVQRNIIYYLDFICVNNTGVPLDVKKIESIHSKIKVINYSVNPNQFEIPTLRSMHMFAKLNPDYKLLYLHTKGISRPKDCVTQEPIHSWVNYMLYCTVDLCDRCVSLLDVYSTVGCNEMSDFSPGNPSHYSGNFWWTTAEYLSVQQVDKMRNKWDPEFFIIGKRKYCTDHYNIYSLYNMYEVNYLKDNYDSMIEKRFSREVLYCKLEDYENCSFTPLITALVMGAIFPGHCVIIIDEDITDLFGNILHKVTELLDLKTINKYLAEYNITLMSTNNITMKVESAMWGLKPYKEIDITKPFVENFYETNILRYPLGFDMNDIIEIDPLPMTRKHLYLQYSINGYVIHQCFDEIYMRQYSNFLLLDFKHYSNTKWITSYNSNSSKIKAKYITALSRCIHFLDTTKHKDLIPNYLTKTLKK